MNLYLKKPVSILAGPGSNQAKILKKINVFTAGDLLRVTSSSIYKILEGKTKITQIESWRSQANLLQIESMTPQFVNVLVSAGIANLNYLRFSKFSKLKEILTAVLKGKLIPGDDQIAAWIMESTEICLKGLICGTVTDVHSKPVKGAEVSIGKISEITDANGRFRLIRVPFNSSEKLVISHNNYFDYTEKSPSLVSGNNAIDIQMFKLKKGYSKKKKKEKSININEYLGEEIEKPDNYKRIVAEQPKNTLRENDIFVVRFISEKTKSVTLVSRFRELKNDQLVIYTWKTISSQLPAGAVVGTHVRYLKGEFTLTKFNKYLKSSAMRSRIAAQMLPKKYQIPTAENFPKAFKEFFKILKQIS